MRYRGRWKRRKLSHFAWNMESLVKISYRVVSKDGHRLCSHCEKGEDTEKLYALIRFSPQWTRWYLARGVIMVPVDILKCIIAEPFGSRPKNQCQLDDPAFDINSLIVASHPSPLYTPTKVTDSNKRQEILSKSLIRLPSNP